MTYCHRGPAYLRWVGECTWMIREPVRVHLNGAVVSDAAACGAWFWPCDAPCTACDAKVGDCPNKCEGSFGAVGEGYPSYLH